MFRLKRGLWTAVSAFALVSLVWGAREALQQESLHGWRAADLDWLVLESWARQWSWKPGLLAAGLGFVLAWRLAPSAAGDLRPGPVGLLLRCLGHPALALSLMFLTRYGPGICAANLRPTPAPSAPNLVLIVVDTWRADHAEFLGYGRSTAPELSRLCEEGVVFERAMAQSGWTKPSVATLLTGMLPQHHLAVSQPGREGKRRGVNLRPRLHTLMEVLSAKGWETGMWSNNPNIIPQRGFDQGASHFTAYKRQTGRSTTRDRGRAEFMLPDVERWIRQRRNPERPFAAYLHIMDPHLPYEAPAPFGGSFDKSGLDFQIGPAELQAYQRGELRAEDVTPAMLQRILDAYDEELAYVDAQLGPFIERLRADAPDCVIVLAGDHGEEFLEHHQFGHAHSLYQELVHVPLVLWAPGVEPARIPYQVRLMDVMPTFLELGKVDWRLDDSFQGMSLLPVLRGEERAHRLAPMETGGDGHPNFHWRALSDGRHKLLRREQDPGGPRGPATIPPWETARERPYLQLFDLELDAAEQVDLFDAEPERAQALWSSFQERGWYVAPLDYFGASEPGQAVSPEELDDLQNLGYGSGIDDEH